MVYARYNELVNRGFVMVYKPTNITGGPHHLWEPEQDEHHEYPSYFAVIFHP